MDEKGVHAEKCKTCALDRHDEVRACCVHYLEQNHVLWKKEVKTHRNLNEAHQEKANRDKRRLQRPGDLVVQVKSRGKYLSLYMDFAVVSELFYTHFYFKRCWEEKRRRDGGQKASQICKRGIRTLCHFLSYSWLN